MSKDEAIELLSTYLSPGLLALVVQAFEQDMLANGPACADKGSPLNSSELKATLLIGDEVLYLEASPADDTLPIQASWDGPYVGIVVGIGDYSAEVRKDGWGGCEPLYRVLYGHILQVNGSLARDA